MLLNNILQIFRHLGQRKKLNELKPPPKPSYLSKQFNLYPSRS